MKTIFIGIGPARCMTTWFVRQLEMSNEVYIPGRKEVKLLAYEDFEVSRYKRIMLNNNKRFSLDYSNDYSLKINTVKRNIEKLRKDTEINIKYVFLYRDPVNRFLSHIELWASMYNLNYSELPLTIKEDCHKQSIYSKMLRDLDFDKTLIINMDQIFDQKNKFDDLIKDFFMIEQFNSKLDKNIGSTKITRIYIFEYLKQKIFQNLEKYDLDLIIKLFRMLKIVDIYNLFNEKEISQSRHEMRKHFKQIIEEILIDYKNFNFELENILKNEKKLRSI